MAQLSIGDHVSDLNGSHDGELVGMEGSTGYVLQANGVELEFPLSRLKAYAAPAVAVQRTLQGPLRDTALSPAQAALLASVPASIIAAVAQSYAKGAEHSAGGFASLPPSKQLEVIRIHLPTLPQRVIAGHMKLVLAVRDLGKVRLGNRDAIRGPGPGSAIAGGGRSLVAFDETNGGCPCWLDAVLLSVRCVRPAGC